MNKNRIPLSLISWINLITLLVVLLFFSFALSLPVFSAGEATLEEPAALEKQLEELKDLLDSSSLYTDFQKHQMLLPASQKLLESGIPFEDTKEIIENSIEKSVDAYSVKKVLEVILEAQEEDLPTEPLINKVNEGLAKNVSKTAIISAMSTEAENLKKAKEILSEAQQEGLVLNEGEEIVKVIADSLENEVPPESLSWLIKTGINQGKSVEEIAEISEELSYLSLVASEAGLAPEKISLLFTRAMESSSALEEVCENIQRNLEVEISAANAKIESTGVAKPSAASDSGVLSSSVPAPTSGSPVGLGGTPAEEAGEAPAPSGSAPAPAEPSTPSAGGTPPPPEN